MVKRIVTFVDWFLVIKRLKVFLFLLFVLLSLLVINSMFNFFCIDAKIIAAYMIALSALFASTVALINLRKSYLDKITEDSNKLNSLINNNIIKINILFVKFDEYKYMLDATKPIDAVLLTNYEGLFNNILEIITDKNISEYVNAKNGQLFYDIHDNLFLVISYNRLLLDLIKKNPQINRTKYKYFKSEQLEILDVTKKNLELLYIEINKFREKQEEINRKINEEEMY